MSYSLKIVDNTAGIAFDTKREKIVGTEQPAPQPYSSDGKLLGRKNVDPNTNLPVSYTVKFLDEQGNAFNKSEVIWKLDGEASQLSKMTTVFDILEYRPIQDYTDKFRIDDYQEIFADNGASSKKKISDFERDQTELANKVGMRKLWDKLMAEKVVAVGEFCTSTGSTKAGLAFLRPLHFMMATDTGMVEKWGMELGVCKEEKIFNHLYEGMPQVEISAVEGAGVPRRLKNTLLNKGIR